MLVYAESTRTPWADSNSIELASHLKRSGSDPVRRSGVSMIRRLNLRLLTVLLALVAVFGGSMHLVHGIQAQRNASALLDRMD